MKKMMILGIASGLFVSVVSARADQCEKLSAQADQLEAQAESIMQVRAEKITAGLDAFDPQCRTLIDQAADLTMKAANLTIKASDCLRAESEKAPDQTN